MIHHLKKKVELNEDPDTAPQRVEGLGTQYLSTRTSGREKSGNEY